VKLTYSALISVFVMFAILIVLELKSHLNSIEFKIEKQTDLLIEIIDVIQP